ncbi:MAG TPA: ACT domain-containing protein [Candidatus Binatia bacterium]|nr:ACT domain-containing protein [Candidatus Binatia bacterium]
MNVFIIDLENKPGQLARIAEAVARKGINITGVSGLTMGGSGAVALLTNDEAGTRNAFEEAGIKARETELVTTSIEDKPGTLAEVAKKLSDAGINIEVAMPVGMKDGKVNLAFATDQPQKAREILGAAERMGVGVG